MSNYIFYDPRKTPFTIHGLYDPANRTDYRRLPAEVADATSPDVAALCRHSAGGRIRFGTDAGSVTIRVKNAPNGLMPHATPLMECGFDLYLDGDSSGESRFLGYFPFATANHTEYEARLELPAGDKDLTINMPLYGEVLDIRIGLNEQASVHPHKAYRHEKPVLFYGSSITQGGCATRPGTCYQNLLSRRFDCDYINFGFSGSAKAEPAILSYMASLDYCAFVSDYDHNAPSPEHLAATHHTLYEAIRKTHPDIPYFMISKPDFYYRPDDIARRDIIMESYLKARRAGDNNVWFIDGAAFFARDRRTECTLDTCHPNDLGFLHMAACIGDCMAWVMGW